MSRTDKNPFCKMALKLIGDYWTILIVDVLSDGPLRFREIERRLDNVNTATLSARLKKLSNIGLIKRTEYSRADVSYELTEFGQQTVPILDAINSFSAYGEKFFPKDIQTATEFPNATKRD